ncbi:MAG TPA: type II secretion system protein [Candidatus Saccharimonadales bacterium]
MNRRLRGFTLIELMIVMVVIVILTILGTVAMGSIQKQAEDSERDEDVKSITRALETYYEKGNPHVVGANTKGFYPSANELVHIFGWDWCSNATVSASLTPCNTSGEGEDGPYYADVLPGVNSSILTPPGMAEQRAMRSTIWTWGPPDGVAPAVDQGYYVYKPLTRGDSDASMVHNGTCYDVGQCGAYVIFYKKSDGSIVTVRSKHQ